MRVTDDKCDNDEESMFVRNWGGTEQGCLVNKMDAFFSYSTYQEIMTTADYDSYISSRSSS